MALPSARSVRFGSQAERADRKFLRRSAPATFFGLGSYSLLLFPLFFLRRTVALEHRHIDSTFNKRCMLALPLALLCAVRYVMFDMDGGMVMLLCVPYQRFFTLL